LLPGQIPGRYDELYAGEEVGAWKRLKTVRKEKSPKQRK
jgi:hypothetical protein